MTNNHYYSFVVLFFLSGCASTGQRVAIERYPSGVLKSVKSYDGQRLDGMSRIYTEDGIISRVEEYDNNQLNGFVNIYAPQGYLWKKEVYEHGRLVETQEYDAEGRMIPRKDSFSCH